MNAETKSAWFQAGTGFGVMLTTLLFYIYFTTPPKADSRPVSDNKYTEFPKVATKRTADQAEAS